MSIFLCLGNPQLFQTGLTDHLSQGILYILFIKQNMQTFKSSVVRSHTTIIQRHFLHLLFGDIPLGQSNSQFFGAVVTVVEENHHITRFDHTHRPMVASDMYDRFDKFVGNPFVIRLLDTYLHMLRRSPDPIHNQIIGFLYTLPTIIPIHSIITTDDRSDPSGRFVHMSLQFSYESQSAFRIGIPAIHKTVNKSFGYSKFFRYIT